MLSSFLEDGQEVTVTGQVVDTDLQPEGMRLFLNQLKISIHSFSLNSSKNSSNSDDLVNFQKTNNLNKVLNSDSSGNLDISLDFADQIYFYTKEQEFLPGDLVQVSGTYTPFASAGNPGQFDSLEYYSARNVVFTLKSPQLLKREIPERLNLSASWKRFLYGIKYRLCSSYQEILGEEQAAAMAAISLGEKLMLEQEQKQLYQEGGISHILAISGLHISLLGMGIYRLLRKCYVPLYPAAVCSGCFLVSYIEMVGWSASSKRACIMFFLWLGGQVLGLAYDRLTALAAAAVILLLGQPWLLLESAFQLSFLSILSLSTLAEQLPMWLEMRGKAGRTLLGGVALQMGMLPCTLYFFYQIPPWSILVNLAVVPLMTFVMSFGLIGGAVGILSGSAGMFLGAPCHYLLAAVTWLCRLEGQMPWNMLVCGKPGVLQILMYYSVLGTAAAFTWILRKDAENNPENNLIHRWKWKRDRTRKNGKSSFDGIKRKMISKKKGASNSSRNKNQVAGKAIWQLRILWLTACLICCLLMQPEPVTEMKVTCLDVGQGDGILLRMPSGETCMIDGGSSSERKVWKNRISQTVKYDGIREIDWWFVSHIDSDHISGLLEYLQDYERNWAGQNGSGVTLRHLVLPVMEGEEEDEKKTVEKICSLAEANGIQIHRMAAGDEASLGEHKKIISLSPMVGEMTGEKNQDSLVLLLEYGSFRMLFTGDLEGEGEEKLTERMGELDIDVLKVGHHGSRNGTSEEFLEKLSPEVAVISCGEKNRYGHPAPETVERLKEAGCVILSTTEAGAVEISSDGEEYCVDCFRVGGVL